MRRLLRLALACSAAVHWSCLTATASECRIDRVTDGDTFYRRDGRRVRLVGIDSPELAQGEAGRQARDALRRLLPPGATVRLELDVASRDRYGRTLAHVWRDGRLVNEVMVRDGWAMLYTVPPNVRYVERLERAQAEARRRRTGLWNGGGFDCSPADFRRGRCAAGR